MQEAGMKKYISGIILAFLFASLFAGIALAQDTTPTDDEVNAVAKQLYCPVCENTPLDVCPTEACRQWRDLIRQQLGDGWTEDQIKQYFVANYGERVLAEPPRQGFNWLVYLIPPAIILAGVIVLFRALKQWTKPKTASASPGDARGGASSNKNKDGYVARLEEELKKRK
jgi:cytochrome c-type biogenesis protein CcmH